VKQFSHSRPQGEVKWAGGFSPPAHPSGSLSY
jgi:hypothetical protein